MSVPQCSDFSDMVVFILKFHPDLILKFVLYVSGAESLLVGPADPRGPSPPGVCIAHSFSPAPSWWFEGLSEAKRAAVHGEHRRHSQLPGRVYTRCSTTRRAHGSQPAGNAQTPVRPNGERPHPPWHKASPRSASASRAVPRATASSR